MTTANLFAGCSTAALRDALLKARDFDALVLAEIVIALCGHAEAQAQEIKLLHEQMAQQQVYVSTLRHKAGITPVDELEEMARAERCAGR